MRWLFAIAALLMTGPAAHAQYTFEYNGKTIRIDPDRGTISIPGVFDNTGRTGKRSKNDKDKSRKPFVEQTKAEPQTPAPTPGPAPSPVPAPMTGEPAPAQPPVATSPQPPPVTAKSTPAETSASAQSTAAAPTSPVQKDNAAGPAAPLAPPPVVATAPSSVPEPKPAAPAPQSVNSPLGLWLTEEKEGRVRIEQCGANLCGYSVDPKSSQNREQVLINMKPGRDSRWSGRIFDPNTGSTYDSTIALKGPDTLRVQGCAFGGMFCGGQTWSRLN